MTPRFCFLPPRLQMEMCDGRAGGLVGGWVTLTEAPRLNDMSASDPNDNKMRDSGSDQHNISRKTVSLFIPR